MIRLLKEFRPALQFLGTFLLLYFVGNVLYGLYVESFHEDVDPITYEVTFHTSSLLNLAGDQVHLERNSDGPTVFMKAGEEIIVSVFEGCNAVNVMIIFVAFLFAFGGPGKKLFWFLPAGLVIIHLFNLARIALLYLVARFQPEAFYFLHKYLFTAILYLVVFGLWFFWVTRYNGHRATKAIA